MIKQLKFDMIETPPKISQWFISLEGEGSSIGETVLFIRLAGCYSAACEFCDTKYSWGIAPGFVEIGDRETTLKINKGILKLSFSSLVYRVSQKYHKAIQGRLQVYFFSCR